MPKGGRTVRRAIALAALLTVSVLPEVVSGAAGGRCETWQRRPIDLSRPLDLARSHAAKTIEEGAPTPELEQARSNYLKEDRSPRTRTRPREAVAEQASIAEAHITRQAYKASRETSAEEPRTQEQ